MGFVLGTELEWTVFHDDGVEFVPAGKWHLVDTDSPLYRADSVFGYAVCGQAVRCWPGRTEPAAGDHCTAACRAAFGRQREVRPGGQS